jgi:hypothetical protein
MRPLVPFARLSCRPVGAAAAPEANASARLHRLLPSRRLRQCGQAATARRAPGGFQPLPVRPRAVQGSRATTRSCLSVPLLCDRRRTGMSRGRGCGSPWPLQAPWTACDPARQQDGPASAGPLQAPWTARGLPGSGREPWPFQHSLDRAGSHPPRWSGRASWGPDPHTWLKLPVWPEGSGSRDLRIPAAACGDAAFHRAGRRSRPAGQGREDVIAGVGAERERRQRLSVSPHSTT